MSCQRPPTRADKAPPVMQDGGIKKVICRAMQEAGVSPYEINNGQCEDFASKIVSQVKGSSDVCTENFVEFGLLPGHVWILFDGKHYDAEAPQGVTDFLDLPIFKRCKLKEAET